MNFFKSVFADDPDPPNPETESESEPEAHKNPAQQDPESKSPSTQPDPNPTGNSGGWMFGDLIKTLASKSESVIETYRRDLQEFGSGLKKEIEVAQGSLETVGHVIDEFGNTVLKGTAQMISQGTDAILAGDLESDSSDTKDQSFSSQQGLNSKRYSRFDAQVRAIQGDASTYCEEPEDLDDFTEWKLGFVLEDKSEEIEGLFEENGTIESLYKRVVPNSVDHETFWYRYFYRVYKLRQAEDVRVNLVKRAISIEEDEELSWDVDDDEHDENVSNVVSKANSGKNTEVVGEDSGEVGKAKDLGVGNEVGEKSSNNVGEVSSVGEEANAVKKGGLGANRELVSEASEQNVVKEESSVEESQVVGTSKVVDDNGNKGSDVKLSGDKEVEKKKNVEEDSGTKDLASKSEEKVALEGKNEALESGKDKDVSVVSVPSSTPEEEDLGWDEIEDLSSIDDKKVSHGGSGSPNRAELRKRLSTAEEEEEDLSWDIEDDDDEPAKA